MPCQRMNFLSDDCFILLNCQNKRCLRANTTSEATADHNLILIYLNADRILIQWQSCPNANLLPIILLNVVSLRMQDFSETAAFPSKFIYPITFEHTAATSTSTKQTVLHGEPLILCKIEILTTFQRYFLIKCAATTYRVDSIRGINQRMR